MSIDPTIRIGRLEPWPAIFSLTDKGWSAFCALRRVQVGSTAIRASPRLITTAAIRHLPEDPELLAALSNYSPLAGPIPARANGTPVQRHRIQVRLAPPVTRRLNRLIEIAGEDTDVRCSRSALVNSQLRLMAKDSRLVWRDRFLQALALTAGDLVPEQDRGVREELVLGTERPKPGPRPASWR